MSEKKEPKIRYDNPYKNELYNIALNFGGVDYAKSIIKKCDDNFYDSNLVTHAEEEFKIAGWLEEDVDESQKWVCDNLRELLATFSSQGHSGHSGSYVLNAFKKLADFDIITPLTGNDDEWMDVSMYDGEPTLQNKRCFRVFKDSDGRAYDIEGIVWYRWYSDDNKSEPYKSYFTNKESRVYVDFPYTPTKEYKEWIQLDEKV